MGSSADADELYANLTFNPKDGSEYVPDWVKQAAPKENDVHCKASLFVKHTPRSQDLCVDIDDESLKNLSLTEKTLKCFPVGQKPFIRHTVAFWECREYSICCKRF